MHKNSCLTQYKTISCSAELFSNQYVASSKSLSHSDLLVTTQPPSVSSSLCITVFLTDCSEFYFHGPLQESLVLVWPRGGPRRVLEKSSTERSLTDTVSYLCYIHSTECCEVLTDRQCHYFLMCFGRPFLWRHTSRSNHLYRQSAVDWIQKQQQLGGQRLFSCLWRYVINLLVILIHTSCMLHPHPHQPFVAGFTFDFTVHCAATEGRNGEQKSLNETNSHYTHFSPPVQPFVGERWRETAARSSLPIILMTTSPIKCVCGKSQ